VTEDDRTFYAEVPYNLDECSDFVKGVVIPLLGQLPNPETYQMDQAKLHRELIHWLNEIRPEGEEGDDRVHIMYDYGTDWDLFVDALNYNVPQWVYGTNINRHLNQLKLIEFRNQPGVAHHHALHDAIGNKYAFSSAFSELNGVK
jgi:hypothetical protein